MCPAFIKYYHGVFFHLLPLSHLHLLSPDSLVPEFLATSAPLCSFSRSREWPVGRGNSGDADLSWALTDNRYNLMFNGCYDKVKSKSFQIDGYFQPLVIILLLLLLLLQIIFLFLNHSLSANLPQYIRNFLLLS